MWEGEERVPGTHWIGVLVGPRAVLDAVVKRKIPNSRRESNPRTPDRPARSPALYRLGYHGSYIQDISLRNPKMDLTNGKVLYY
jgi:hypothetical protein